MRAAKAWTQSDLANAAEVSRDWIARLETGRYASPAIHLVQRVASALDVELVDILASEVRRAPAQDLVNEFLGSPLAAAAKVTPDESRWLLSIPTLSWVGGTPNVATIYKLLEAYRTTKG
jgi:transcriptional regulator with XRE-family HTH domain